MKYQEFLAGKKHTVAGSGREVAVEAIHAKLFDFQKAITRYATRKGTAAIFADTGLGKTFMQLEWARLSADNALIVAPLSVARQTVREAAKIDVPITYARRQDEAASGVVITNYEMVEHFDPAVFGAVVLDESSILKALDGKTRQKLTEILADVPRKLCCTATPAPNDIAEIANHAEFLGTMTRAEMLAMFFVHDDEGWRLKGHAEEAFYRWMASWGMSVRKPSDLGFPDDGYNLPPLNVIPHAIETAHKPDDRLFFDSLKGIQDRSKVRKATTEERVRFTVDLVNGGSEQWIIWCGLNQEADLVHKLIPDSVNVEGSQAPEMKATALEAFQDGQYRVLISKARIAGFGMNFQNAHNMAFLGLSDSWEAYYQCIRRQWRFGQTEPVTVHVVLSEAEVGVWENVKRKEAEAERMSSQLIEHVKEFEKAEINSASTQSWQYEQDEANGDGYHLLLGDSSERLAELESESVGLSVFSPPFMSLFTYSPTERDIGNCKDSKEFWQHFHFIIEQLWRVTQPGRNCCVHVAQVPAMLARDGYIGIKDFRGETISAFSEAGWIYHGDIVIDKDPQAQAIRTHSKALLFVQVRKDSIWSRPALADYILVFRKPGDNAKPINPDITNDEWIEWARPIWYGIRESDTLNVAEAREEADERHICPLQLGTIERCIRLWSNPGDTILSPFAGIGSEGYMALKLKRRFIGIELKKSYYTTAIGNLEATIDRSQGVLFAEDVA